MSIRRFVSILIAEFLGTYVLATAMMAMLVRTNFTFFSGLAAAFVYGLFTLIFGTKVLTHMNPAVTLGQWTVRKINTLNAFVYIVVQLVAGYVALRVGQYFLSTTLTKTATGGFNFKVMIAEGIGALIFSLSLAAAYNDKKLDIPHKAVLSGFGLFVGVIIASLAGNGLINPAVAISVNSVSWAYILGPLVGAVIGFNLYEFVLVKNFNVMTLLNDGSSTMSAKVSKPSTKRTTAKKKTSKK